MKRKHVHTATGKATQTEVYSYRYDHRERLLEVNHQLNSNPAVNLLSNRYDALGRLKSTSGHDQAELQTDYTYNVRSWVKGISNPSFKEDLSYSYNGNISSQQWQQDGKSRKYTFDYDGLSRLKQAAYTGDGAYGTAYVYDKRGNITDLQRYDGTMIDNLTMTYQGNRLIKTDDATNDAKGFTEGVKVAKEYFYDANGNLTEDLNKNITTIQYNYLNLPSKITFGDGSTIAYLYGADGTKFRTTHTINGTVTTTDYCDNVIYENGTATRLLTEAGYVSLSDNKYYYYLQDHQGNNRVVINQSGTVEETNHYYPFGSVFANTNNVQPYKYNGKELDSKKGLNWHDYGARHYDAALGRFMTVDPLSEKYYGISPYGYCANNPVKYVDPTGMLFSDPPGNYFQNLWSYYKEVYKSVSVTLSVGLQVGASAKISNKEVGAHVNVVSGELEVLNDGKFSVNNRSVTQGVDVNVGVVGVGITNEVKDNGSGTTTKTETFKAHAGVLEAGAKTTSEHIENRNGTYTEVSKKTEVFAPTATLSVNAQVLVGAEVKVDIGKIWQAFKDFVKNTFNPN